MIIQLAPLSLKISLAKPTVLAGEEVSALFALGNLGKAPIETASLDERNNTLKVTLTPVGGKPITRDQAHALHEQGIHVHTKEIDMVTIAPGGSTLTRINLGAWFGDLEPGEYTFTAQYRGDMQNKATSEGAKLTVNAAAPVKLTRPGDGARASEEARALLWQHQPAAGAKGAAGDPELYLLSLNNLNPAIASGNQFISQVPPHALTYTSIANTVPGIFTAVAWTLAPGKLRMVKMDEFGKPAGAIDIGLPDPSLYPLGPIFCDDEGIIWIMLRTSTGDGMGLARVPKTGTGVTVKTWKTAAALPESAYVLWGHDEAVHWVWFASGQRALFTQSMPLVSDGPTPARKLGEMPERIVHARLDDVFDKNDGMFRRVVTALCHDDVKDQFNRVRVGGVEGNVIKSDKFMRPGSGFWRVLDCAMLQDTTTGYLFVDMKGEVYFGGADLSKPTALTAEYMKPLTAAMQPAIIAGGGDPVAARFYLAYIREGKAIERRVLGR